MAINIEFKAKSKNRDQLRSLVRELGAEKGGILHQHDTYFKVKSGRKKLRLIRGSRSELITYFRSNAPQARESKYFIKRPLFPVITKFILKIRHGILAEVEKERELWIWKSVRIHIDRVKGLGDFMELEAVVDQAGSVEAATEQCAEAMNKLKITKGDMISTSYCDMVIYH